MDLLASPHHGENRLSVSGHCIAVVRSCSMNSETDSIIWPVCLRARSCLRVTCNKCNLNPKLWSYGHISLWHYDLHFNSSLHLSMTFFSNLDYLKTFRSYKPSRSNHHLQGDHLGCPLGLLNIKKVAFHLYLYITFVLMSTKPRGKPEWSPCRWWLDRDG